MSLNRVEKDSLVVSIEGFLTAMAKPEREQLVAMLELDESMLERGRVLIESWHQKRGALDNSRASFQEALDSKDTLKARARLEMRGLINLIRRHFYNDEATLRLLNLNTKRKTVTKVITPGEEEKKPPGLRIGAPQSGESDGEATGSENRGAPGENTVVTKVKEAVISPRAEKNQVQRWRSILDCIPLLSPETVDTIGMYGFDETRRESIRTRVEDFAASLAVRDSALVLRSEHTRLFNKVERDLLTWVYAIRGIMAPKVQLLRREGQNRVLALMAV